MYQEANKALKDQDLTFMLNPFEHEEIREKFATTKVEEKSPLLDYISVDQLTIITVFVFIALASAIMLFMVRESIKSVLELAKTKDR